MDGVTLLQISVSLSVQQYDAVAATRIRHYSTDKVIRQYGFLMHNFPQSPKGFYSMDIITIIIIIIIVYNDKERKVSKNSSLCSLMTILPLCLE
jgi:hypothetical protein